MSRKNPEKNNFDRSENRINKIESVLKKRQFSLTVVAENIYDPHNFSAMLRSCDAVGVYEVCLIYDGSQPFPKLGNKSSASAKKWINIKKFRSIANCYKYLREEGKLIYTTHLKKDSKSLYELDLTQPVALVFGNEHYGLSEKAVELADDNFLIPQVGFVQSLNISVATAVSLYEAFRQRYEKGMYSKTQISGEKYKEILENWLKK